MVGRIRCSRPRGSGSGAAEWLLGRDRPGEAGELARAGDDDLLLRFAAAGHPLPALVEALLAAPGALNDDGVLAALAAGELVADRRPAARVPGRLDQQSRSSRGLCVAHATGLLSGLQLRHELLDHDLALPPGEPRAPSDDWRFAAASRWFLALTAGPAAVSPSRLQ